MDLFLAPPSLLNSAVWRLLPRGSCPHLCQSRPEMAQGSHWQVPGTRMWTSAWGHGQLPTEGRRSALGLVCISLQTSSCHGCGGEESGTPDTACPSDTQCLHYHRQIMEGGVLLDYPH